jgi:hypothetical protein
MISGFRREVAENCSLLGQYTAGSGNSLQTYLDNLLAPSSVSILEPEDGISHMYMHLACT